MVLENLKYEMPLRNISRISGISLSRYYYRPRRRHIQRLVPSTKERFSAKHTYSDSAICLCPGSCIGANSVIFPLT